MKRFNQLVVNSIVILFVSLGLTNFAMADACLTKANQVYAKRMSVAKTVYNKPLPKKWKMKKGRINTTRIINHSKRLPQKLKNRPAVSAAKNKALHLIVVAARKRAAAIARCNA